MAAHAEVSSVFSGSEGPFQQWVKLSWKDLVHMQASRLECLPSQQLPPDSPWRGPQCKSTFGCDPHGRDDRILDVWKPFGLLL